MIYFVKNMIEEKCPENKIQELAKIDMIINNMTILYGYDVKFYNNLMIYVFIKDKPILLNSTFRYIKMYLDSHLLNKYSSLLNKIEQVIKSLSYFNEKHLYGNAKKN